MMKEEVDLSLRQFIKQLGFMAGGAAVLSSMPWLTSCTAEKLDEIKSSPKARVALIGTGSRGCYHLTSLQSIHHAKVVALCDIYPENLKHGQEMFPDAKLYTDYRKLLEDKNIDGVIIATPLGTHARITLDSLSAGKHVFCEKAMARTMDECKSVYDAYIRQNKVLYYCMQRMYDEKYIKGFQMIHSGEFGEVVGMRCHWFRNSDWRRPVPSPELERMINWRLYKESSGGLMTELASHQLEVCTLTTGKIPVEVSGFGDIIFWKDGREVYDNCSLVYRFSDGRLINYQTLISNKYNGMEDQILCHKGTVDLSKGIYYLEEDDQVDGMRQLLNQIRDGVFAAVPVAGPSWRPEVKGRYVPHAILKSPINVNSGQNMTGVENDGSVEILSAFCQSCITGQKAENLVEEAYCSTMLCLLGNKAMDTRTVVAFPDEYKISYMKF